MTREEIIEAFKPFPVQLVFRDQNNIFMPGTVMFNNYESDPITVYIYPYFFEVPEQFQPLILEHEIGHLRKKLKWAMLRPTDPGGLMTRPACDNCGNSGAPCVRCGTK